MAVDRLTALPESLLVHILNFLPIEDAVKTEVLSKRWQYLWTYLPSFLFRCRDNRGRYRSTNGRFVAFIEKTLILSIRSKLNQFKVDFEYEPCFARNIHSWTRFAMSRGVEELYLEFEFDAVAEYLGDYNRYTLPQFLYTNSSFKRLCFSLCNVMPRGVVVWNTLKELSIGYVKLSDDVIGKILAGSPVLEILEFYNYRGFSRLHITNTSVKKVILKEFSNREDEGLEISAPYLQSLEILGRSPRNCLLKNLSSLVDATLICDLETFDDDNERIQDTLRGLLASLVRVKRLTVGAWAAQVLLAMEANRLSSRLLKCECLTLNTSVNKSGLPGVTSILKSSPNFETLFMTVSSTANIEVAFPHRGRRGRPNHPVSSQGLLDKILAKLHLQQHYYEKLNNIARESS